MTADNSKQMEEGLPLVAPAVETSTESRPTQFRAKIAIATVLSLALVCLGLAANPYMYYRITFFFLPSSTIALCLVELMFLI